MDAQAGANTPGWLHRPATQLAGACTNVLEKKMTKSTALSFEGLAAQVRAGVYSSVEVAKALEFAAHNTHGDKAERCVEEIAAAVYGRNIPFTAEGVDAVLHDVVMALSRFREATA